MQKETTKDEGLTSSPNDSKPIVSSSSKLNGYHIETLDGTGSFNFFTEAGNHEQALRNLETKSFDYKRLVKTDKDLTITVKKVY